MKTVLITGVAGFLGSHLCDKFIAENWNVIGLDNLITGSVDNIAHLLGHQQFKFIHYDVTHYLFFKEKIDLILHFACPASPLDYFQHPIHTMKVDSLGTLNTLGLAKQKKSRYVFASTSEIYGTPQVHPQPEEYWGHVNPIGIRAVYDEAKRFSESMCMAYFREHEIDVRLARIFNTYGTRMRLNDGRVIPTFIYQALQNEDITIFGDGSQTRSFCYVDDLVSGIYKLSFHDNLNGSVFNLGNVEEFSISQIAQKVLKKTNSRSKIIYKNLSQDDPDRRRPDISKAKKILDFNPRVSLSEGLERIIPWFKEKISG